MLLPRFYDITGGSADIIHSLPFQCVALSHVNLSFYSISIHLNIYVDLGVGREARHRKQTGNGKIINDAKRLYIYIYKHAKLFNELAGASN